MARRSDIDKEALERDYRAGQLSFDAICSKHGVSKSTLSRYIKDGKWERDQSDLVRTATKAKILRQTAEEEVKQERQKRIEENPGAAIEPISEIDVAAAVNVKVVMGHRRDIQRLKSLAGTLTGELEALAGRPIELQQLIAVVSENQPDALQAVMKFASLNNRVATAEKLANTLTRLITLERQAFGLDEDSKNKSESGVEDLLRAVHGVS